MHRLGFFYTTFSRSWNKKVFEAVMETAQGPFEAHKLLLAMGKLTLSGATRNDNLLWSLHTNTGKHKQVLHGWGLTWENVSNLLLEDNTAKLADNTFQEYILIKRF